MKANENTAKSNLYRGSHFTLKMSELLATQASRVNRPLKRPPI